MKNVTEVEWKEIQFKSGQLQFDQSDYNYLTQRLDDISQFNYYNEAGGKRYYQKALNRLMNTKGFDIGQMLSKIQSRQSTIVKSTTVDGALRQLADIYNWKIQSGKIRFEVEGNLIVIKTHQLKEKVIQKNTLKVF